MANKVDYDRIEIYAQTIINKNQELKWNQVEEVRMTKLIFPSSAGCPEDCPNFSHNECYWLRYIKFKFTNIREELREVLACLNPKRARLLKNHDLFNSCHDFRGIYTY